MMISRVCTCLALIAATLVATASCSTTPKSENRETFVMEADATLTWFETNVAGLRGQIDNSAGYIVYPNVGQWGVLIGGGKFGRGALYRPDGTQTGWAAVNTVSAGLQAGAQGFKMLVVIENEAKLQQFKANRWSGGATMVAVAGQRGGSATGSFDNGVVIYHGSPTGLMAGVNMGLDYMRYQPLSEGF